ncbi:MAG: helix-turn-helix domain-containing protein [Isosphaeraceae bacterium]
MGKSYEELTPVERAKVDAFRARRRTPAALAEEQAMRESLREEFPPATPHPELAALTSELRAERERLNLSLADVAERSGLDKTVISRLENNRVLNPTFATLARYAAALQKRVVMRVENLEPIRQ